MHKTVTSYNEQYAEQHKKQLDKQRDEHHNEQHSQQNSKQQTLKGTIAITELCSFAPCEYQHLLAPLTAEDRFPLNQPGLTANLGSNDLWSEIMNALQYGVLIVTQATATQDYCLLYTNLKAQQLCYALRGPQEKRPILPKLIVEICDRWYTSNFSEAESLVMECLGREQQTIRAKVRQLNPDTECNKNDNSVAPILILLENCDEEFETELSIECKKYALTEREADVWKLLRQGHTYQEAAKVLHLSVNTINTHVKRIHSKRQTYQQDRESVWMSYESIVRY